jgi:tripartite-type tricarboxylate transporter receptor subunit TctC
LLAALAWCAACRQVRAQAAASSAPLPSSSPVRLLVPAGAGGVVDLRARWLAPQLSAALQRPVVVENKPGAGGNLGMEAARHAPADGSTIVVVHQGVMTMNPHLYAHPGYDPLADFVPLTRLGIGPLLMVANPQLPARSVSELVALAREQPGRLAFGSPGIGTPPHLAGELFKRAAGIDVLHVPYRGGSQAAADLIAGHVQFEIESLTVQLPHVLSGRVRPLAITGPKRVASLPEVPTVAEAGWPQCEFRGWVGLALPAKVAPALVQRLYEVLHGILGTPQARAWFAAIGAEPGDEPPAAFEADIRTEHARWGQVIRDAGIHAD